FSTAHKSEHFTNELTEQRLQLREDHPLMNQLFTGAAEAAEEAILNSLSQAVTTKGRAGRIVNNITFTDEE
ncbi:MAG: D-aminopeptidase, partial [Neobacillus sp.]|nr:D-aminopeptidase [Neobacillus sp.]